MSVLAAVPNTDAGDGSNWWGYLIVAALIGGALYKFYVDKIRKK